MARFFGTDSDFLSGHPPPIVKPPFSISLWWKKDTSWSNPFSPVIWIGNSTTDNLDEYLFYINNSGWPYYWVSQGGGWVQIYAMPGATISTYHHCAIVELGTSRKIYHNHHSYSTIDSDSTPKYPAGVNRIFT